MAGYLRRVLGLLFAGLFGPGSLQRPQQVTAYPHQRCCKRQWLEEKKEIHGTALEMVAASSRKKTEKMMMEDCKTGREKIKEFTFHIKSETNLKCQPLSVVLVSQPVFCHHILEKCETPKITHRLKTWCPNCVSACHSHILKHNQTDATPTKLPCSHTWTIQEAHVCIC